MRNLSLTLFASATALASALPARAEPQIEVLHHWVSESEVAALNTIREALAAKGYGWQDSAVGGMSGGNMQQALRSRLASGNPPGAMQFIGWEGVDWSGQGVMRDLNALDEANGWEATIAPQVLPFVKDGEDLIAVPVNMHRQNWVWASTAAFDKAGIDQPNTWAELIASGEKLKAAGVVPLAMGDEPWQIQVIFDALVADIGGPDFYRKAVVDLDEEALSSDTMKQVFDTLRQVRGLVDDGFTGRDWAVATGMIISGDAAMQVMGDWAKGEFLAKGMKPGIDFLCFATPSETPSYQFLVDSFGMFEVDDPEITEAQDALAEVVMDPTVQHDFNQLKGSIPARTDLSVDDFDECAQKSFKDRTAAIENNAMLGAATHGFASQPQFSAVFGDVTAQFFVGDMSSEDAVQMLVDGINNAR
ncbi:carbohydrate ABC transporter substrate-binding protein [Paracoccus liaowanqingii]|uniref:Probable sugar-binding periplasmic protein n=1 Tax=Paracoccus liaowanqingii TaxID=2560053 RepID=A0A4Z1CQB8_9RHOB|nr:ABC transporter substrate-binding protein [Paracoccus liaowanqingii]TGN67206.1 carbohydrate ABC transporter substrate-binding protein [Paracoccus liaowanqingii]